MFFEKNTRALAQNPANRGVIQRLATVEPATDVALYETATGDYSLEYRSVLIHSLEGAEAEAQRVCDEQCHPGLGAVHIVLGLGLGYLLQRVFERSRGKIFLYEPELPLLRFVLENVDLSEYLGASRVYLSTTVSEMIALLTHRFIPGDNFDVLVLKGTAQLMAEEIPYLMERLVSMALDLRIGYNTVKVNNMNWVKHFFDNMKRFPDTTPLDLLAGAYAGKPALIVSAGPSLDEALPTLKAKADNMVIIAVGRSLRRLLEEGIRPDFVAFWDFKGMEEQLRELPASAADIPFFVGPYTQACCYEATQREKFLMLSRNYATFADWVDDALGHNHLRLGGGGSVSIIATQTAMALGCHPVILVGQDLALKGEQMYAGSDVESKIQPDGYLTLTRSEFEYGRRVKLTEIPGQNGETLRTTPDYLTFLHQFQDLARENAKRPDAPRLINASLGGALIDGFEHLSLAEALADYHEPVNKDWRSATQEPLPQTLVLDPRVRVQRLRDALKRVLTAGKIAVGHATEVKDLLECMVREGRDALPRYTAKYKHAKSEFTKQLNAHPLLNMCVQQQTLQFTRNFSEDTTTEEGLMKNLQNIQTYFGEMLTILQENVIPWAEEAIASLESFESKPIGAGLPAQ